MFTFGFLSPLALAVITPMIGALMNVILMQTGMKWASAIPKNKMQKPKLQNLD